MASIQLLTQLQRCAHQNVHRESPMRKERRDRPVALEHALVPERVCYHQQIHVAVPRRLAVGMGAEQDDPFGLQGFHDTSSDLL